MDETIDEIQDTALRHNKLMDKAPISAIYCRMRADSQLRRFYLDSLVYNYRQQPAPRALLGTEKCVEAA